MPAVSQTRLRLSPVFATNGLFLMIIGGSAWFIAALDTLLWRENAMAFWISGGITLFIGAIAYATNATGDMNSMDRRQVLFGMITAWTSACLFAALPFWIGQPMLAPTHALFESVSAITTTGATVIVGIDALPKSVLLWRSMLHWYGGMGIIIGAMVLFPAMRVGGMQFFSSCWI